ncbi:DUF192 domain-containing protein [Halobellus salinisoli]|uniref:DUF192 domain-containing protein n=1 Tax=Halobellus salinisoli TaxID=3108500 RepID=UPI00300A4794
MRVVHDTNGEETRTLAGDVDVADTFLTQARGLMFRRSIPEDYAMAFTFEEAKERNLHMVFVPFDLDALWIVEGEVRAKKRLRAWRGFGAAVADAIVELPAGVADGVEVGDAVRIVE